jgi:phosphinothricin acetyltransferase
MEAQPKAIMNTGGIEGEPVHVALAGMVLPNDPSTALHCKLGFTEVGVFHEYAARSGQYLSSV